MVADHRWSVDHRLRTAALCNHHYRVQFLTIAIWWQWVQLNYQLSKIISIHHSIGSPPVGAQCPLTSSLGEFLGYRDWLWYPGLLPVLVSMASPFPSPSISQCFLFTLLH